MSASDLNPLLPAAPADRVRCPTSAEVHAGNVENIRPLSADETEAVMAAIARAINAA